MTGIKARKKSNTFVWIILAVLVVSLTGFGVRQIGTSGAQAVGTVGDEKITVNSYQRALSARLRSLSQQLGTNVTIEQARSFGVDRLVLAQLLNTTALDNETGQIGLSVGDELVKKNLLATQAFQDVTGKFDEGAYKAALRQANLTASEYDAYVRKDAARSLLQISVGDGVQSNGTYGLALYNFIGETRNLTWAPVEAALLPEPTRAPTEAEIQAQYDSAPANYTAPETRKITYAELMPADLVSQIAVDDAALKDLYDSQPTRFHVPARRIVDRLVYPDEAAAKAAMDALMAQEKTFEELVAERGLTLNDVDMGEVTQADLGGAAGESVFLLVEPGFAGPVETDLGPAIFRVNAVLDAQDTSFEAAQAELHGEYVADRARRQIDDSIVHIDDLLAGGARLEDIVAQTDMKIGTIDLTSATEDGIAAHEEFRSAAAAAAVGDLPQVITLADGGIFALRLDSIVPPALIPLTDIREKVASDWKSAETHKRLLDLAATLQGRIEAGEDFAALGLSPLEEANIHRQNVIEAAPSDLVKSAFEMTEGQLGVVSDDAVVAVVKITQIKPFDEKAADNASALKTLNARISGQIGNDIFAAFATAVQDKAGVTINQSVVNAVLTTFR